MDYRERYQEWCESGDFDEATKKELEGIRGDEEEIKDRFYQDLEFGTGGLRGVIGAGTNRMNLYTVGRATQGLADYIKEQHGEDKGVAIAYDSRHMSPEFSDAAALCLAANGIKAYRFESLRPTPELSFALRELGCIAGIVVTASHNPPQYNGYKVYWEDGAQVTAPKDEEIIRKVNQTEFSMIRTMDREEAKSKGLYITIGSEIDDKYMDALKKQVLNPELIKKHGKDLKIVYSPFHGTGNVPVRRILSELGFENVYVVPEQELPDGDFTTLDYPNPEDKKAFKLALELAAKVDADLVLATDPDADRLGVYAKDSKTGEYMVFTGNMSGMLICEYILSQRKERGLLKDDSALIKTIVSTNMADKVAQAYGLNLIEVLTGFKFIGEQIKKFEDTGKGTYEFGFEESYGCLVGTHARDKDAIVAVMCLCEAAAYYAEQNMTLWDQMIAIYEKYGYFKEGQYTMTLAGADGAAEIKAMMEKLRQDAPKKLGCYEVLESRDYARDVVVNTKTGATGTTGLPKSNVLYFALEDDAWCCVRPSGTEPKIKFYAGIKGTTLEDDDQKLGALLEALEHLA